jgi:hypothetical protein
MLCPLLTLFFRYAINIPYLQFIAQQKYEKNIKKLGVKNEAPGVLRKA